MIETGIRSTSRNLCIAIAILLGVIVAGCQSLRQDVPPSSKATMLSDRKSDMLRDSDAPVTNVQPTKLVETIRVFSAEDSEKIARIESAVERLNEKKSFLEKVQEKAEDKAIDNLFDLFAGDKKKGEEIAALKGSLDACCKEIGTNLAEIRSQFATMSNGQAQKLAKIEESVVVSNERSKEIAQAVIAIHKNLQSKITGVQLLAVASIVLVLVNMVFAWVIYENTRKTNKAKKGGNASGGIIFGG
jgi:hypothetical protein